MTAGSVILDLHVFKNEPSRRRPLASRECSAPSACGGNSQLAHCRSNCPTRSYGPQGHICGSDRDAVSTLHKNTMTGMHDDTLRCSTSGNGRSLCILDRSTLFFIRALGKLRHGLPHHFNLFVLVSQLAVERCTLLANGPLSTWFISSLLSYLSVRC